MKSVSRAACFILLAWLLPPAVNAGTANIAPQTAYQTIEGLGGAIAFYNSWVSDHPYKQEIYTNAFAGLNLSMLRLGNWYRYNANFDSPASDIVSNANRILGHPVPIFMSSWSPPAFLKSNGQVGNGGTLIVTNGGFAYTNFANYWYDSLQAYRSNGVSPAWISIQNEPDWAAGYDSCIFHPTEDTVNGTNYASYSKALEATFQRLTNLPSPPKLLAPEVVGLGYNDVQKYAATMNSNSFYGLAHHLYGGSADGTPNGYIPALQALTNVFPGKPKFMTEYGVSNLIEAAWLIHNTLTVEQASGYNFWSLVWPVGGVGLVQIENPYDLSSWTNAPPGTPTQSHGYWLTPSYWAMKHFSYFINPGYKRVSAADSDTNVLISAYLSPDNLRLVVVLINTSSNSPSVMNLSWGSFGAGPSGVYQTAGTNTFQSLGSVSNSQVALPALSLTTIVLNQLVSVGPAANPSPANNATGLALNATLNWVSGSNALTHAVYLGMNSNAVAQATPASPEFKGILATNNFSPAALAGGTTYFWRVDEIAGVSTNAGPVWSFSTVPAPVVLAHRYSFSETSGATAADSVGGPAWNGTLPNGGTFGGGQLALSSNRQQYVQLPANILSNYAAVTIESWATFPSQMVWNTFFYGFGNTDSGGNGENYIFCAPQGGRIAITGADPGYNGEQNATGAGDFSFRTNLHFVAVYNPPGGTLALYTNGLLAAVNNSVTVPMSSVTGVLNYIGRSLYTGDAHIDVNLDEFRIYNGPMSTNQIAATQILGPNQVLSASSPTLSASLTGSSITLSWPLPAAGFGLTTRTNLSLGNWVRVTSPTPQIIGNHWQVTMPVSRDTLFFRLVE
jgi:glucuronoarabinoxylan endo-1,4-beta-xylanase